MATMTMGNKRDVLRNALVEKYPQGDNGPYSYVEDLTDSEVIYSRDGQLYKAPYTISETGKAEIGEGVKVMAQTLYTAIESLRETYHKILAEVGIKEVDDRVSAIVQLCSDVLNGETPQTNFVINPALWEATAVLKVLQEAPMVRKVDGKSYPIQAFAYAPNKYAPGSWQLRTWENPEAKVTKKQLQAAAAALSPGGYNGKAAKIPAAALPTVKRTLRAAYRKLGIESKDMPKWIAESETRERLESYVPLTEAEVDTGKGRATVVVIKAGFNTSKSRYYPAEMLKRDYAVFEGAKMYSDHPTKEEDAARPERSIRDWVATLSSVTVDESGTVTGVADIIEDWLKQKLASLSEAGQLSEMGISIDAVGSASKSEIDGTETLVIERLESARSVDFVTEPGAGGGVKFYEADRGPDIDLMDLAVLTERRPDLIKAIQAEVRGELKIKEGIQVENEQEIKGMTDQIATLTKELETKTAEIAEAAKVARVAETKALVDKAVAEAELPDIAKTRLLTTFAGAESDEGLKVAIKAEINYVAAIKEGGKVVGMGPDAPGGEKLLEADREAYKASVKRAHPEYTDEQLEIAANG